MAFRKLEEQAKGINYAIEVYRYLNRVYALVSTKVLDFNSYIQNPVPNLIANETAVVVPVDKIEAGVILLAHPRDENPMWSKSVILILKHNDQKTLGVILNKKEFLGRVQLSDSELPTYLTELNEGLEDDDDTVYEETTAEYYRVLIPNYGPLHYGGPVDGFVIIHTRKDLPKSHRCSEGLYYSISYNANNLPQYTNYTKNLRIFYGNAQWQPGQLQSELEAGSWFLVKCPLSILFPRKSRMESLTKYTPPSPPTPPNSTTKEKKRIGRVSKRSHLDLTSSEEMWSKVLRLMGGEYYHFSQCHTPDESININKGQ
jgi:putative transcriptional regulator